MLYVEFNDDGTVARERSIDPPVDPKLIDTVAGGKPRLMPLVAVPTTFDPDTEKPGSFAYQVIGNQVRKVQAVISMTAAERKQVAVRKALARRAAALPVREHEMEAIYEALLALIDFAAMLETPAIKLDITPAQLNEFKNRLALLKANPIP